MNFSIHAVENQVSCFSQIFNTINIPAFMVEQWSNFGLILGEKWFISGQFLVAFWVSEGRKVPVTRDNRAHHANNRSA